MKKIEFGYSNDIDPRGSFEGIGIKPGLMLCEADYVGSIGIQDNNYIVAKVTEDEYNNYPQLLDKFIVRRALCDLYADGSCVMMLDQNEDLVCEQLENRLNNPEVKDRIESVQDVTKVCNGAYLAPRSFMLAEMDAKVVATSITTEAFDKKNEAIKYCNSSISQLKLDLAEKYNK